MRSTLLISISIILSFSGCSSEQTAIQEIESPASDNSKTPRLFTDNTGAVFMSWVEETSDIAELKFASFEGESWSSPQTISSDSTWFVNWADYPSVIAHDKAPMAAHWLNKVEGGTYAYHVNMATFDDQWSPSFTPHMDESPTEHGFVSMTPATDSSFIALWLDGRHTHDRDDDQYSDLSKAMTLRSAIINTKGEVLERHLLDDAVCDCCNTAITKTENGFLAAYRDRTNEEIRDIYVTSFTDGSWSEPKPVHADNWSIGACPVNGPAIDAYNNTAAVAWFTGAEGVPHVQLAISKDHGETFDTPISLDRENPLGRVDLNMTKDKVWVSWLADSENGAQIKIQSYTHDGDPLSSNSIDGLSKNRNGGFPHISLLDDRLLIAYTDVSANQPKVRTMILE
ncbi:MAG: hypothetical protein WD357_03655 [Gracilimonas sp.]